MSAVKHTTLNDWGVGRYFRPARLSFWLAAALISAMPSATAIAASPARHSIPGETIDNFYAARNGQPLWFGRDGEEGSAPQLLVDLIRNARVDGLNSLSYAPRDLERALRSSWSSNPETIRRADRLLSEMFVAYARDMRRTPAIDMIWVDPELRPAAFSPRQLLDAAASAPSLERYVADLGWMNPIYAGLRRALVEGALTSPAEHDLLRLNLERARALPAGRGKAVIVNATAAELVMTEDGRVVDSMRVVVGKPVHPTPMMAAMIRFTSLNPYWNVPVDLAAERIAPNVVKGGAPYLRQKGYQLLSSWADDASVVSPSTVDWSAVAAGKVNVRVRQLPGPENAMGRMKFMFPNAQGIYLHDTPEKKLLGEDSRMFSGGCVRLEDAPRLARWLYGGKEPSTNSTNPEQRVDLPRPVPVYLTYLTAIPNGGSITYLPDVYNRDPAALAALDRQMRVASR
ncbi:MAG: L,D-transpeptidase family protein [Sphingomicrobium sp.]